REALELLVRKRCLAFAQLSADALDQMLLRALQPSRGRRTVNRIGSADLIWAATTHEVHSEHVAITTIEAAHGAAEGSSKQLGVFSAHDQGVTSKVLLH